MKIKGEILNVLRFEDTTTFGDNEFTVLHREHWDETRWGQIYRAVVKVNTDSYIFRFTHEEPSTERSDPEDYNFDENEFVTVDVVYPVPIITTKYFTDEEYKRECQ